MELDRTQIPPLAEALFVPSFFFVAVLSLLPPPGLTRVVLGLTALSCMWVYAYTHWIGGHSFVVGPMLAFAITFRWILMVVLGTPEQDHPLLTPSGPTPDEKHAAAPKLVEDASVGQKLAWSATLWCSWRDVRQTTQQTRVRFCLTQTACALLSLGSQKVLIDHVFCSLWPQDGVENLLSLPILLQYKLAVVHLVLSWLFIDCIYRFAATIAVLSGLSSPERWSPAFGSIADLYSVGNFWGRVWHQMFRKNFVEAGILATRALGIKRSSKRARLIRLYVGFLVAGVQHYVAAGFVLSPAHGKALFWQMPCYAAIITSEELLSEAGRRLGIQSTVYARCLGYLWTAFWIPNVYRFGMAYYNDIGSFASSCPA